jgi:Carbohydrate family 9 binding domain-like
MSPLRILLLCIFSIVTAQAAGPDVATSTKASKDTLFNTNPASPFWSQATPTIVEKDKNGSVLPGYRTEIRSRWTNKYLYFLFTCPYEELFLKPKPASHSETNQLWNWDVAEVFLGSDFTNIKRYKEFEMSPQGEWIDLDIDLTKPHHEDGWRWNSGFEVAARIDKKSKIWYGAMRIPWSALSDSPPSTGNTFRVNFFRSQGPKPNRKDIAWQPTMSETFHVPERFGSLQLIDKP